MLSFVSFLHALNNNKKADNKVKSDFFIQLFSSFTRIKQLWFALVTKSKKVAAIYNLIFALRILDKKRVDIEFV
jgi:hypothetical protein